METLSAEKIKKCAIGLLEFTDKICKDNDLQYFLCGGTLLGAVRHHGFIPWDDDIDIMMPRKDYERLFEVWPKDMRYKALYHKNTHNFPYAYGKIIDDNTIKTEPIRKKCQHIGIDIDVFPIDNIPDNDAEALTFYKEIAVHQYRLDRQTSTFGKNPNTIKMISGNTKILIRRILELFGFNTVNKLVAEFSRCAIRYNKEETSRCGITSISHYGIKEINSKNIYDKHVNVTFEGKEYPAPIGYKTYLSQLYGEDYMEIPPIEKQATHHEYKAYWK